MKPNHIIAFIFLLLLACNNSIAVKETQLAKEMNGFLRPGKYDVALLTTASAKNDLFPVKKGELTISNSNLGFLEFKASSGCKELDSIRISYNDSMFIRENLTGNHMMAPFTERRIITAAESGLNEDYFAYIFSHDNTKGSIAAIPEFRQFFSKENVSGTQFIYTFGIIKNSRKIIIRAIERVAEDGKKAG
jgi:sarcosine oxidase delta subunit